MNTRGMFGVQNCAKGFCVKGFLSDSYCTKLDANDNLGINIINIYH
jgi:hypothetical protein